MNIPESCDVVVIGGGPAGSLAATFLAQKGYDVVLLEKAKHPRYAVGESLIPDIWKYIDAAGAKEAIEKEGFLAKAGGTISWGERIWVQSFKDFGYTRPALHVERDRFDYILIKNAAEKGAKVFEEVMVSDVKLEVDGYQVVKYRKGTLTKNGTSAATNGNGNGNGNGTPADMGGTITCRYVIDATGQSTLLGKKLGLVQVDEAFRHMSVWGYFTNSDFVAYGGEVHPWEDISHTVPTTYVTSLDGTGFTGWSWHIPLRESTSVGLVIPRKDMKTARQEGESWETAFLRTCRTTPILMRLLENATFVEGSLRIIRDYSYVTSEVAGPGFFLVGDAAGFHDPIFSVGVVLGMYAAFGAAWAIDRCMKNPASEKATQDIYTQMLRGRIEMARSLALPAYRTTGSVSDMARNAVGFESAESQKLMYAVAKITDRDDNYRDLTGSEADPVVERERIRTIAAVNFLKN